jgi:hypothetical protein
MMATMGISLRRPSSVDGGLMDGEAGDVVVSVLAGSTATGLSPGVVDE